MFDETPQLQAMHSHYQRLTGLLVPFSFRELTAWREFRALGYSSNDLELVVRHLKRKHSDRQKFLTACRFKWFIENRDNFSEELAEARALARKPRRDDNQDSVLRSSGRPQEDKIPTARSAADIMAGNVAFSKLLELKKAL